MKLEFDEDDLVSSELMLFLSGDFLLKFVRYVRRNSSSRESSLESFVSFMFKGIQIIVKALEDLGSC